MMIKEFSKLEFDLKVSCMYFRVFKKFRVCTCIHDTRYTIHDIDKFRVYTVTSLIQTTVCRKSFLFLDKMF